MHGIHKVLNTNADEPPNYRMQAPACAVAIGNNYTRRAGARRA
jgi:hypothetical protein